MKTKDKVWRIELIRKHIRLKKFRYSVIIVITTLVLAALAITYVAASNESTLQFLHKLMKKPSINNFDILTKEDFLRESFDFLKFGIVGKVMKILIVIWIIFVAVCILTPTRFMRKCVYRQYENRLLRPVAANNMLDVVEYTYSNGNLKAKFKGDMLTQVNVPYDEKETFMGRLLTIDNTIDISDPILIIGRYFGEYSIMEPDREAVYLSDAAFREHYGVFGEEEAISRILSDELMEHLVAMSETYKKIAFKVTKDKLIVAYDTEIDAFRLSLKKTIRYDSAILETKRDIKFITDVIEINNLLKGKRK